MGSFVRRLAFKVLGMRNYLRLVQKGFFFSYNLGTLKDKKEYEYHYFVAKLINEGDTVVDIGANLGYYSKLFSKWVGDKGKVYSVEPIAIYNDVFRKETKDCKNITLLSYALGAEEKAIELVTSPAAGYLRTGLPHVYDKQRDGKIEDQKFRFEAKMTIPDKLFKDIESIDYVKCDVEGFEYIVLQNMKETIERAKPTLQIELWGQNETLVLDLMTSHNYSAYKLKTLNDGTKKLSSEAQVLSQSGDYIFIHNENEKYNSLINN